jgi:anti-anti-sigma factor
MTIDALSDGATVLVLDEHRLDSSNAGALHEDLESATESAGQAVVIDMESLAYISSAGLRVIMQAVRKTQQQGGRLALCSLSSSVRAVFETSGFDQLIDIHPSRVEAVAAVATET